MSLLLQRLSETYEMIIVDMPPLAAVVDGVAISSILDSVVLIAEWGATPLPVLSEVTRSLRNARAEILGAVINKVDPSTINYGKPHSQYLAYVS
jgi:Mrp family chromosome partitioning ATPase